VPEEETKKRAAQKKREGKAPSTQAGEFVREEMHHIREGKHGASSPEQAIAIGLSKARKAGVDVPPPEGEGGPAKPERSAKKPSAKRSRASRRALDRESGDAASTEALSRHGRKAARQRTAEERSEAARKGARTKGAAGRSAAAKKAAATRAKNRGR
jgi:hypothetical protein